MIQRVQSLYLAIALIFTLLVVLVPLAFFKDATGIQYKYNHSGLWQLDAETWKQLKSTFLITVSAIISMITILVCLFSYNNRKLQIKIAWGSIVLLAAFGIEIFLLTRNAAAKYNLVYESLPWTQVLPWLSIIAVVSAIRNIQKDEQLVRSADRLR